MSQSIYPLERRSSFVVSLLVSFCIIFGVACIIGYNSYTRAKDAAIRSNGTRAALLASLILEHQRATIGVLQSYARRPLLIDGIKRKDFEGVLRHLADLAKNNPEVEWPYITNPDSTVWVNFPVDKGVFNKDLSGRDWYKGVSREWKPYISGVYKMVVGEKDLAVTVCAPVFDEKGKLIGILGAAQSTVHFRKIIGEVSSSSDVNMTLIDQEGHIICSNRFHYTKEVTDYPPLDFVGKAKKGEQGDVEIQGSSDGNGGKYVSFAPIGGVGWSVIVEKGKSEVLQSEYSSFALIAVISFLIFAVVVLSLVNLRARQRQIRRLEKLNEELDGRVRERTAELEVRNQSLNGEIAERKKAEEALRASEDKFSKAFNDSPNAITITRLSDGKIIEGNESAYNLFGYSHDEVIGKTTSDLKIWAYPADRSRLVKGLSSKGFIKNEEFVLQKKDVTQIIVDLSASLITISNEQCFLCSFIDITARKKAEDAVAAAHRQIQSIIDNTPAIVYAFDLEERFVMANTAVVELLNSTPEQMIGKRRHEFMSKEDADWHEANDHRVIEAGRALDFEEYSQLKGRSITWLTTKFPLRDAQGRIYAVAGISADITERKRAEEALRKAKDELELRVQERTEDLAKSQHRLQHLSSQLLLAQEKERKRVAVELHDGLLSELAAMKYLVEGRLKLVQEGKFADPQGLKRVADILAMVIKEARGIMNNLHPSVLDELGLLSAISWLTGEYEKSYPNIKVQKRFEVSEKDVEESVRIVIFRVLQEALNNFAKHGKGDRVELSLVKSDSTFEFAIQDNGQGFDVENAPKGLGLESMRERVELSGGKFEIESILSEGTTIRASWKTA